MSNLAPGNSGEGPVISGGGSSFAGDGFSSAAYVSLGPTASGGDDTAALQAAVNALPAPTVQAIGGANYLVSGGGTLLLPSRSYQIAGNLQLPPLVRLSTNGWGTKLKATNAAAQISVKPNAGAYNQNGIGLDGIELDGNAVAVNFLLLLRAVYGEFTDLLIHGCTGDGLILQESQYNSFKRVQARNNGATGGRLEQSADNHLPSNDNEFLRCEFFANTTDGLRVDNAAMNRLYSCAYQNNGANGLRFGDVGAVGNVDHGGHYEQNATYGVYVNNANGRPGGNKITDPTFVIDASGNSLRFVANEGSNTHVRGGYPFGSSANMPTTNASQAQYQQDSSGGSMILEACSPLGGLGLTCDQTGASLDTADPATSNVTILWESIFGKPLIWDGTQAFLGNVGIGNANPGGQVLWARPPSGSASSAAVFAGPDTGTNDTVQMTDHSTANTYFRLTHAGSAVLGKSAPATTATDGFPYIPTVAGAPTGVPTATTGFSPIVYDSTNHKFWIYDGGWKGVVLA